MKQLGINCLKTILFLFGIVILLGSCGSLPQQSLDEGINAAQGKDQNDSREASSEILKDRADSAVNFDSADSGRTAFSVRFLSVEETMQDCGYILDAEYIGCSDNHGRIDLRFVPQNVIKGSLAEEDQHMIHVFLSPGNPVSSKEDVDKYFVCGKIYMLCLDMYRLVFYEYNEYVQRGAFQPSEDDDNWDLYHQKASGIAQETGGDNVTASYGNPYTTETDIHTVIDSSSDIFWVTINEIIDHSRYYPVTVYQVEIEQVIKHTQLNGNDIIVTLFNDSVEVGSKYLLCLVHTAPDSYVYTLTAKDNAVFSENDVEENPILSALLGNRQDR